MGLLQNLLLTSSSSPIHSHLLHRLGPGLDRTLTILAPALTSPSVTLSRIDQRPSKDSPSALISPTKIVLAKLWCQHTHTSQDKYL